MKSAILLKKQKIQINNFLTPKLRDDQILVKVKYAGICRSQIMEYLGKRGKDNYLPHCFGHEGFGVVKNIGAKVKKIKIGDEVILSWIKGKGLDYGGFQLLSIKKKKINFGPINTFSSEAIVSENRVFLKPAKMSSLEAVFYGCAIPTGAGIVLNVLKKIKKNSKICLIGVGGVGVAVLLCLLKKKCNVFVLENNKFKLKYLKKFKISLLPNNYNLKNYYNFFDYCIETSGLSKMIECGIKLINNKGTLVFASHPSSSEKISISPHDLIKGKKILGTWGGGCKQDKDINKIFKFFGNENVYTMNSEIKKYKLSNISVAFKDVLKGNIHRAVIHF